MNADREAAICDLRVPYAAAIAQRDKYRSDLAAVREHNEELLAQARADYRTINQARERERLLREAFDAWPGMSATVREFEDYLNGVSAALDAAGEQS